MSRRPGIHRDICGTYEGWSAHNNKGEIHCVECIEAANDVQCATRINRGQKAVKIPVPAMATAFDTFPGLADHLAAIIGPATIAAVRNHHPTREANPE